MSTALARPLFHLPALLPAVFLGLALSIPGVAEAKRGGSSHASSHAPAASGSHASPDSHASSKADGGGLSVHLPRPRSSERESSPETPATAPAAEPSTAGKRPDTGQKAAADAEAARKLEESLTLARQKAVAEQAAQAAAEEKKRREAEQKQQDREQAKLEEAQRQYAWESRCQIKSVMSDEEIVTCREVWTRPAPKQWVAGK